MISLTSWKKSLLDNSRIKIWKAIDTDRQQDPTFDTKRSILEEIRYPSTIKMTINEDIIIKNVK